MTRKADEEYKEKEQLRWQLSTVHSCPVVFASISEPAAWLILYRDSEKFFSPDFAQVFSLSSRVSSPESGSPHELDATSRQTDYFLTVARCFFFPASLPQFLRWFWTGCGSSICCWGNRLHEETRRGIYRNLTLAYTHTHTWTFRFCFCSALLVFVSPSFF